MPNKPDGKVSEESKLNLLTANELLTNNLVAIKYALAEERYLRRIAERAYQLFSTRELMTTQCNDIAAKEVDFICRGSK